MFRFPFFFYNTNQSVFERTKNPKFLLSVDPKDFHWQQIQKPYTKVQHKLFFVIDKQKQIKKNDNLNKQNLKKN